MIKHLSVIGRPVFLQIFKFIISGLLSAAIEIGILILLVDYYRLDYLTGNIVAFLIVGPTNFLMNKYWVFEKGTLKNHVQFISFTILALLNLLFNQFLLWLFVEYILLDYKISKVLAIGLCVFLNFIAKKYLIFGKKFKKITS